METGLRAIAVVIDLALALATGNVIFTGLGCLVGLAGPAGQGAPLTSGPAALGAPLVPILVAAFVLWPVLFLGIPTGLWGRTPGKWILGLRVVHAYGHPPSVRRALAREALKLIAIGCAFGAVFCLIQILYTGTVWYDQLCATTVEHSPSRRLTKTQREFRKAMRQFRSGR